MLLWRCHYPPPPAPTPPPLPSIGLVPFCCLMFWVQTANGPIAETVIDMKAWRSAMEKTLAIRRANPIFLGKIRASYCLDVELNRTWYCATERISTVPQKKKIRILMRLPMSRPCLTSSSVSAADPLASSGAPRPASSTPPSASTSPERNARCKRLQLVFHHSKWGVVESHLRFHLTSHLMSPIITWWTERERQQESLVLCAMRWQTGVRFWIGCGSFCWPQGSASRSTCYEGKHFNWLYGMTCWLLSRT